MVDRNTRDFSANHLLPARSQRAWRKSSRQSAPSASVIVPPAGLPARRVLRLLWNISRLPVLLPLVVLEPIVAVLLGGLALLGLLVTVFFTLIAAPHFPAGTVLAISISFALALVLYEGAIEALSS